MKYPVLEKNSTDAERVALDLTIQRIRAPKGQASTEAGRGLAAEAENEAHKRADAAFDASVEADKWDSLRM